MDIEQDIVDGTAAGAGGVQEVPASAGRFRIADAHAHIYPAKIATKATEAVGEFYHYPMHFDSGTSEGLLASGAAIGVERYLVCSVATTTRQVASINTFIAGECAAHPEFLGLGAYHPDVEDAEEVLDQVAGLGLVGIKIHPDIQGFDIDDPRMLPVYSSLERRRMPILIHMGDARYDFSAPQRLARVLERTPDLRVQAAHLGGHQRWEDAMRFVEGTNVYVDESSCLAFMEPNFALELVEHFGTDRVMFGVDFPMWDHVGELQLLESLQLGDAAMADVLYNNFARFYGQE